MADTPSPVTSFGVSFHHVEGVVNSIKCVMWEAVVGCFAENCNVVSVVSF